MAHGTPDWGLKKKSTVYALDDMAELAARLGSIVTFDRRGDVIFLDDFEASVLHWTEALIDTGDSVALSTAQARNKSQGVKAITTTTNDLYTGITRSFARPTPVGIGIEFSYLSTTDNYKVWLNIYDYNGSERQRYAIVVNDPQNKLYYTDQTDAEVELGSPGLILNQSHFFHTMKLVYDPTKKEYVRLIFDSHTFSMSGKKGSVVSSALAGHVSISIRMTTTNSVARTAYIDDFILTQNEPT